MVAHRSYDVAFIVLYFLEQAVFIVLVFFYPDYTRLLVGFFALVVVSTVSLQKIMMESKNRKLRELNSTYLKHIGELRGKYEQTINKLLGDIQILEEDTEILRDYVRELNKLKK